MSTARKPTNISFIQTLRSSVMRSEIEPCIQQIELLLRGGATSNTVQELKKVSHTLLTWYSSSKNIEEYERSSESERAETLGLAIKLHNKARSLTSPAHSEIRACLKATAAWMLAAYGGDKIKVLSAATTILSKAGEELANADIYPDLASKCLSGSILYWNRATSLSLHKTMSPVDLQDMKTAAFWAHLEKAKLLWRHDGQQEEIRKIISGAAEIMQTLPPKVKMRFAERVMELVQEMSKSSNKPSDTIHLLKMALNAIDSAQLPSMHIDFDAEAGGNGEDADSPALRDPAEIKKLRLRAHLSLAFLYMQAK
jgi:hypothetical protein